MIELHMYEFRIGYHVFCNIRVPIFYNEKILLDCLYGVYIIGWNSKDNSREEFWLIREMKCDYLTNKEIRYDGKLIQKIYL